LTRWDEEILNKNKIEVEILIWPKLEELIKFKDLIELLISLIDLFKNLIEQKLSLKVNWVKIEIIN